MSNSFSHYVNDAFLINAAQKHIEHHTEFNQNGYTKLEHKNYYGDSHTFIVDWEIPENNALIKA
jgi:hypothetical protein